MLKKDCVYLSINDTSKQLGISAHTLREWIKANKIPFIRVGAKYMIDVPQTLELLRSGGVSQ